MLLRYSAVVQCTVQYLLLTTAEIIAREVREAEGHVTCSGKCTEPRGIRIPRTALAHFQQYCSSTPQQRGGPALLKYCTSAATCGTEQYLYLHKVSVLYSTVYTIVTYEVYVCIVLTSMGIT